MRKVHFYALLILILLGFLLYLSNIIFKEGYIYHTDVTEALSVNNLYQRYLYTYSNDIGESLAEKARIPLFYFVYGTFKVLSLTGLDDSYFVKTKIYLLISLTLGSYIFFAYRLLEFIKRRHNEQTEEDELYTGKSRSDKIELPILIGAVAGGLYYVLNYWATNRIVHFYLFFSPISILITFYYIYTYLFSQRTEIKKLIFLAIWLAIFTATPHTVLFETLIVSIIYIVFVTSKIFDKSIKITRTIQLLGFSVLFLLLNIYWILPYLVSLSLPDAVLSETIVNLIGRYASINNSVRLMGYWLANPKDYFIEQFKLAQIAIAYVPLLLSLLGVYLYRKKPVASIILILLISSTFLSTASVVTNKFYFYLMFNSPLKFGGWIFREYDKFGILISFVYAFSIGLVLSYVYKKKLLFLPTLLVITAVLVSNAYYFNKELTKRYSPVNIPDDFITVTNILEQDSEDFNVAWYPGVPNPFWARNEDVRFTFSNLISPKPSITTHSTLINYLTYLLQNENIHYLNVGKALDAVGVKYLIVRKDESIFEHYDLEKNLDLQTSLEKVLSTNLLIVYLNKEYTGLVKFYKYKIATNYGLDGLKNPWELSLNTRTTFIDYLDKPSQIYSVKPIYDLMPGTAPDSSNIDAAIDRFQNKFIYPFKYATKKDDGNAGHWKLGSLEDINHAETQFFFSNLGLDINQFDYKEGVVVARDGWKKAGDTKSFKEEITPVFSNHPNLVKDANNYRYTPSPQDFKYYWNIIRSDKFNVEGKRALELKLASDIDPLLVPHYKIYTYDGSENILNITFVYPDERNNVNGIIKVPPEAKYADFSIWTLSEQGSPYSYNISDLIIRDISDQVAAPTMSFSHPNNCDSGCRLFARVLISPIGGKMAVKVNGENFDIETKTTDRERYQWVELGKTGDLGKVGDNVNIELLNNQGFNSVNAVVFLNSREYLELQSTQRRIASAFQSPEEMSRTYPKITVKQLNPTRYEVTISGASGETGVLAFAKPFNKNWELVGHPEKPSIINGYINGWETREIKDGTYYLEFRPQRYFYFGAIISVSTLVSIGLIYFIEARLVRVSVRKSKSQG
ncbi:MAG TPA: hypothetical protein VJG85_01245 [Patescibacteria group bacterium]|nr:hypothetical protein [Patescibacteria group bacterium]